MESFLKLMEDENAPSYLHLEGDITLDDTQKGRFSLGRTKMHGLIDVRRANLVIDGEGSTLILETDGLNVHDLCLFRIHTEAENVCLKNLTVRVHLCHTAPSVHRFTAIYNTSFGLRMENCRIEVVSDEQANLFGVYNDGNLDTHLTTHADNLTLTGNTLRLFCDAKNFMHECAVYGLYNRLANSISVQNNYIYATNRGVGKNQKAIGAYTNGRFGRFVGNNFKANCTHNVARQTEQAHAYGFINEGLYTLLSDNNILGEWAGKAVGLENAGAYAKITGNKILATHTMCGRSVRCLADNCLIENNMITTTSRNPRLVELSGSYIAVCGNLIEALNTPSYAQSGCGIYAVTGEHCIIKNNIVKKTATCGILTHPGIGIVKDNCIVPWKKAPKEADVSDHAILDALDENKIKSIEDE